MIRTVIRAVFSAAFSAVLPGREGVFGDRRHFVRHRSGAAQLRCTDAECVTRHLPRGNTAAKRFTETAAEFSAPDGAASIDAADISRCYPLHAPAGAR